MQTEHRAGILAVCTGFYAIAWLGNAAASRIAYQLYGTVGHAPAFFPPELRFNQEPLYFYLVFLAIVVAATLTALFLARRSFGYLGLNADLRTLGLFGLGLAGGAVIVGLYAAGAMAVHRFGWVVIGGAPVVFAYLVVYHGIVAVSEELAFRGFAFRALCGVFPPWAVVLVTSLAFAYAHLPAVDSYNVSHYRQVVSVALFAVLAGVLFLRTGSMATGIGVHLATNLANHTLFSPSQVPYGLFSPDDIGWREAPGIVGWLEPAVLVGMILLALAWKNPRNEAAPPAAPSPGLESARG